jgi:hypothetical protein
MSRQSHHGPTFTEQEHRHDSGAHGGRHEEGGLGGTVQAVKDKARDLASGASDVAGQVKDKARDWTSSAASGAGQAWDATRREVSDWAASAENAWEGVDSFVRRYPLPSLLIALGLGFAVGSCMSGMRRRPW